MKMFLVEIFLKLVIYVRNVTVETQKNRFPFIIISTIVPNDTSHSHVILKISCIRSVSTVGVANVYYTKMLYKNEQRQISNRSQK